MGTLFSPTQQKTENSTTNTNQTTDSNVSGARTMPSYLTDAQQQYFASIPGTIDPYIVNPASVSAPTQPYQQDAYNNLSNIATDAMGYRFQPVSTAQAALSPNAAQASASLSPGASLAGPASLANASYATPGQISPGSIASFMSPYIGNVVNSAYNTLTRSQQDALAQNDARSAAAGSFGGSRQAVGDAMIQKNYQQNLGDMVSNLLNSGWTTAGGLAATNAGLANSANIANAGYGTNVSLANSAAQNLLSQFNAGQTNNMNQFNAGLQTGVNQFNTGQTNNMDQFNAGLQTGVNQYNAGATNAYNLAWPQEWLNGVLQAQSGLQGAGTQQQQTQQNIYDTALKALLGYGSLIPSQFPYSYNQTGNSNTTGTSNTSGTATGTTSINPLGALLAFGMGSL